LVLGLVLAVMLAFLFPDPGSRDGFLQAGLLNKVGIALILFLQGLSLARERVRSSAGNWRLHLVIQTFTFVVYPLVGLALDQLVPLLWASQPVAIRQGVLYLCVLPSTISTSVVLTAVAKGNTPGALFNAALSNIAGVVVTPLLVFLLIHATGETIAIGPLLLKVMMLTLLPFACGMVLRTYVRDWVAARNAWANRISNLVILLIVYTAFCDSIQQRVWQTYGLGITINVLVLVSLLLAGMSALVYVTVRGIGMNREDMIAGYFCSVKKTLAMGVPLAVLIFGESADLSLILLPLMMFHPLQLVVNGILANHWARE